MKFWSLSDSFLTNLRIKSVTPPSYLQNNASVYSMQLLLTAELNAKTNFSKNFTYKSFQNNCCFYESTFYTESHSAICMLTFWEAEYKIQTSPGILSQRRPIQT